ncbi:toxin-antitoxin system YwqK family antitoxin [Phocaeicola sp.]
MKYKIIALALMIISGSSGIYAQKSKASVRSKTKVENLAKQTAENVTDAIGEDTLIQTKIELPKDRVDTIYYDRNWKVIGNKTFASYYRFALYPVDSLTARYFKTYYISGELQGEGNFISLDERGDSASLLEGETLNYFKNGKISERLFYSSGMQNGEHTIYYENGNIKEHCTLSDGKREGIFSSFTEDGKVCQLTIYKEGIPADFYIVTDMDGNYSKYDTQTNKPVFETPSIDEIQTEYKNGVAWPYYNKNGLIVGTSISMVNDIGKYREIGIFIVNKSMINVELDPTRIEVAYIKKGKEGRMKLMSADEYDQKIFKNKKKVAKKEIKKKIVVTTEKESNVNTNLGASVFEAGTSNTVKAFQESIIKLKELISENRMHYAEGRHEDLGYLERTTVHPGEVMSGFIYTETRKVDKLLVKVTINGITYIYE